VDDLKLIVSVGIISIYFLGINARQGVNPTDPDQMESVRLINELNADKISLEIIQLE
jgi:hypothetical protein